MTGRALLSIQATPDTNAIRTETFRGVEHTVIPCVALVEGVLWPANAPAPELALAEEFGRFPDSWNGRPIVLNHPVVNGLAVSASSDPRIFDEVGVGQLFNTKVVDNALHTELWIDEERVATLAEDVQNNVQRLKDGDEMVEVSTGLFTMSEVVTGEFGGQEFNAIWRNIVPDHLAILPEGVTGACSVEDGCGAPRTNKEFKPVMNAAVITSTTSTTPKVSGCKCGGACDKCQEAAATTAEVSEQKGIFKQIFDMAGNVLRIRGNARDLSDRDVRTALMSALAKSEDFFYIVAVFDNGDGSGTFVFETFESLFEQQFKIDGSNVEILGERVEVRPVTQFVPITSADDTDEVSTQETHMKTKDELVKGLIDNTSTKFSEDDREWLTNLSEEQLVKLEPAVAEVPEVVEPVVEEVEPEVVEPEVSTQSRKPVSTEDYVQNAPTEVREVLNESLRLHRARKDRLIEAILANKRNRFSKEQLTSKPLDEIEGLASLASTQDISYEGAAPSTDGVRDNSSDNVAPAPLIFERKSA